MSGLLSEAPVPLQSNERKQSSPFNDIEGRIKQPAPTDKDMSGNHKFHDTNQTEIQPWEPTPLPLLERNALMAHPDSQPYYLNLIQPPQEGRVNAGKSKGKPLACSLHPEPILELKTQDTDPYNYHRTSPHFMCIVELVANDEIRSPVLDGLGGSLVSSLHNLKLKDDKDHAYFIFGDLCPKFVGIFCLKFVLFEMRSDSATSSNSTYAKLLTSTISQPFVIKEAKGVGISKASTPLTRMVAECGVKIRVRKEPTNKRKQSQTSWAVRGPTEPNLLRVQAPVLKDVLGFDPSQPQYPNHANSRGVHSQYASRPVQNPFPTHMGQITPPTRGVEGILDRVSMQMPNSTRESTSKTEGLSTDNGHLNKKVHPTQESHSHNLNHLNVGSLRQYRPNPTVMAGYGAQASPLNNDPAYQTPGSQFVFNGAINTFTGLTAEANTGPGAHFFNVPSGHSNQLSNTGPGFSPPMSASASTTNSQMGNMVSPLRSRTGRDGGSSAGFGSRSQFSSFSSGLVEWDPMVTSTDSYDPLHSSSIPNNSQNTANMPYSGSMLFANQNNGNVAHTGSVSCTTPYTTSMSSISQYIPRLPDATSQVAQYSNSMANATQDPISMAQMPLYNSQYPSSTGSQGTQKFAGYEWQFGSGYGATPGMVSHG